VLAAGEQSRRTVKEGHYSYYYCYMLCGHTLSPERRGYCCQQPRHSVQHQRTQCSGILLLCHQCSMASRLQPRRARPRGRSDPLDPSRQCPARRPPTNAIETLKCQGEWLLHEERGHGGPAPLLPLHRNGAGSCSGPGGGFIYVHGDKRALHAAP
jgi:hypothetical protein